MDNKINPNSYINKLRKSHFICYIAIIISWLNLPVKAQEINETELDIPQEIIEDSPALQRWLQETPNVLEDIRHDPAFSTRFKVGFSLFPSNDDAIGINIALEDVFISNTSLTISANYYTAFNSDRVAVGANLHYFLFPLGSYINFAPLVGYRYIQSNDHSSDGINLGLRLILALSRTGAADLSLSQSFVSLGSKEEIGITALSVGYAFTSHLRLSTDIELQNSPINKDNRFSLNLEWLL